MNKKTGISIIIVIVVGVIVFVVATMKPTQENKVNKTTSNEEYIVDPSDMVTVEDKGNQTLATSLTVDEKKWLILMREEEKLARDVYMTLGAQWGMNIFSNIAKSEQTHTDSVKVLLDRYGINDSSKDDTVGVFVSPVMQKLYTELVQKGSNSVVDALFVGATIEDLDIHDLDNALQQTSKSDIRQVYENLQKGSRNHLRAFVKNIEMKGGVYSPQYISVDSYQSIISSVQEKGRI